MQVAVASLPGGSALQPVQATRKAGKLIACIVEPRADQMEVIDHVVQNVADFLGPSVPIQFYHGNTTDVCERRCNGIGKAPRTCQLHREGRVELHPMGVDNLNSTLGEYSQLLTSKLFWETKLSWKKRQRTCNNQLRHAC